MSSAESTSRNVRESPYATIPQSWSNSGLRPKAALPNLTSSEALSSSLNCSQAEGYACSNPVSDERGHRLSATISSVATFDLLAPPSVDEKNQSREQLLMNRLAVMQQLPIDLDSSTVDQSVSKYLITDKEMHRQ